MNIAEFGQNWANKSPILVTGHTGFKGTWLTLMLRELGIHVVGFSLKAKPNSMYERLGLEGAVPEIFADIRDEEKLGNFLEIHKPSAIFHLAGQPLVIESYKDPKGTFDTNVMGTANLLKHAEKISNLEAVLVTTTDKVYRNENTGHRFIESDPLQGIDPYSASKVATEAVIKAWQGMSRGSLRLISARSGNVIGGGDYSADRVIPDCVRAYETSSLLSIRNPGSVRPWQHVLEPLAGYLLALGYGKDAAYNFGPSEKMDLTVLEVVEEFREQFKFEYQLIHENEIHYESSLLSLDSSFAQERLNWRPTYTQKEAIKLTANWWRSAFDGCNLLQVTQNQIKEFISLHVSNATTILL